MFMNCCVYTTKVYIKEEEYMEYMDILNCKRYNANALLNVYIYLGNKQYIQNDL